MVLSRGKQLAGAHERDDAPGRRGERDDRSGPGWILAIAENGKLRKKKGNPGFKIDDQRGERQKKTQQERERRERDGRGYRKEGKNHAVKRGFCWQVGTTATKRLETD
jgi:hypothetical protein